MFLRCPVKLREVKVNTKEGPNLPATYQIADEKEKNHSKQALRTMKDKC
jgi:hypothetical protein